MKALIVVDMQNDFMPGGALGVPNADQIIPKINELMNHFSTVYATLDWHPKNHVSFAVNHLDKKVGDIIEIDGISQILWPVHCVQNTFGAELVKDIDKQKIQEYFHKGIDPEIDSYSVFFDNAKKRSTGLEEVLLKQNVKEVVLAGVATEYCVLYSAMDAIDLGFKVTVVTDACKPINLAKDDEKKAFAAMAARGVHTCLVGDL